MMALDVVPRAEVYPRVCGGTPEIGPQCFQSRGLSPRVRGNPQYSREPELKRRSIPACAGEPSTHCLATYPNRVYPRVCGGTSIPACRRTPATGLSPRVRGNLSRPSFQGALPRSIPACAGEPPLWALDNTLHTVYPRVCGGTRLARRSLPAGRGLSPRVRGNLYLKCLKCGMERSIPACAGEPTTPSR